MFTGLSAPLDIYCPDNVSDTGDSEYSTTKYEYNELGKLARMTDPLDKSEAYKYDVNGSLTEKTDRNGNVTLFTYDGLGRNLSRTVTTPDGTGNAAYSYTYNFAGNRLSDSIGGVVDSTCKYDDLGRLISRTEANGITMDYTYDLNNNRKSLVIKQNGTVITNATYDYDTMNRLWHVYEGDQLLATYTYDVNGNREKLEYTNGNSTDYEYNLANKVTELINLNGTTEELSHFDYTYYLDGNQESKNDAVTDITSSYTYDGLGRLVGETETSGSRTASTMAYTYDDSNNRMTMNKTTSIESYR